MEESHPHTNPPHHDTFRYIKACSSGYNSYVKYEESYLCLCQCDECNIEPPESSLSYGPERRCVKWYDVEFKYECFICKCMFETKSKGLLHCDTKQHQDNVAYYESHHPKKKKKEKFLRPRKEMGRIEILYPDYHKIEPLTISMLETLQESLPGAYVDMKLKDCKRLIHVLLYTMMERDIDWHDNLSFVNELVLDSITLDQCKRAVDQIIYLLFIMWE